MRTLHYPISLLGFALAMQGGIAAPASDSLPLPACANSAESNRWEVTVLQNSVAATTSSFQDAMKLQVFLLKLVVDTGLGRLGEKADQSQVVEELRRMESYLDSRLQVIQRENRLLDDVITGGTLPWNQDIGDHATNGEAEVFGDDWNSVEIDLDAVPAELPNLQTEELENGAPVGAPQSGASRALGSALGSGHKPVGDP